MVKKTKYCKCHEKLEKVEIKDGKCCRCGKMIKPKVLRNLEYYKKNRQVWKINPQTRVEKDKTKYDRNADKRKFKKRLKEEGL